MIKILIVMDVTETHKQKLSLAAPNAEINYIHFRRVTKTDVNSADIIIGNIAPSLLQGCNNLKLLQLNSAGTDGYTAPGVLPANAKLANATGAYGLAISEHMLAMLLCLMKKLDLYKINQTNHTWKDEGPVTSIYDSNTLVVGLGDIGNEFAIRMNALGSTVTGIKRKPSAKPDYIDSLHKMDALYDCLEKADIVASALPGTSETYKLFNDEAFAHMKKNAYFINVGRGNAVDTDSLCKALESSHIAGAALDVTDPEPLPSDHKLWTMPNVLITPHVSGGYHLQATHDKIIDIAIKNIKHLINNEPFENLVNMSTGYRDNQ